MTQLIKPLQQILNGVGDDQLTIRYQNLPISIQEKMYKETRVILRDHLAIYYAAYLSDLQDPKTGAMDST